MPDEWVRRLPQMIAFSDFDLNISCIRKCSFAAIANNLIHMTRKGLWIIFAVLAILIGFYPGIYFLVDRKFGLLNSKSEELLANPLWNTAFYIHIIFGGLALLVGWTQFSAIIRNNKLALHRTLGKVYVTCVCLSSVAAIYISFFATGGLVPAMGFFSLGVVWLSTTLMAYVSIRNLQIVKHQKMMTYSYAACFAAVTLRIWLPLLISITGNFITAYSIVAWLCWVPNILVAFFLTQRLTTGTNISTQAL